VEGRDGSLFGRIAVLAGERRATVLVVGLPLRADGSEGDMSREARRFAGMLEKRFEAAVVLWDERFSSAEADRYLTGKARTRKGDRDAAAASIILQSYLDSLTSGRAAPGDQGADP